jgi:hypothetical protein
MDWAGTDEAGRDEAGRDEAGTDEAGTDEAGTAGADKAATGPGISRVRVIGRSSPTCASSCAGGRRRTS